MYHWDDNPDLNITPFVDVMLVLMAILMVTAPTITYQEQINLPKGSRTKHIQKSLSLTIRMDRNKKIYFGQDSYTIQDFADNFMLKASKFNKKHNVYIRADASLPYKDVIYLLRVVKKAGFLRVSLVTQ